MIYCFRQQRQVNSTLIISLPLQGLAAVSLATLRTLHAPAEHRPPPLVLETLSDRTLVSFPNIPLFVIIDYRERLTLYAYNNRSYFAYLVGARLGNVLYHRWLHPPLISNSDRDGSYPRDSRGKSDPINYLTVRVPTIPMAR